MREPLRRTLVWAWPLVVVALVGAVFACVWWGGSAADRSDRAGIFFGALGVITSIVVPAAVWAWRRRSSVAVGTSTRAEVDAAADRLAEQTLETWSRQAVERGIQSPAPVQVLWRWATDDIALPPEDLAKTPPPTYPGPLPLSGDNALGAGQVRKSGLVTRLHDVYAQLQHGRLVLIGGPGAGKTGAMILLMLEALRYREQMTETVRVGVPVPVWLTLGSWDPRAQSLRDWVTATMSRDHPYLRARDFGPDAVGQLFDTGRIALFLDGLDEMPDTQRSKAIERLNAEAAGRRLVMTSRPDEFRATIGWGHRPIHYTAVIELQPVGPEAAAEYLVEGQIGAARQAWQAIADHLMTDPNSVLAKTLNTPLTLSLARTAYKVDNPGLLMQRSADEHELRVHLLDQVLIAAYPDLGERARVTYWLGWLAHRMVRESNGPIRELRWWQIPGWISRWQLGFVAGLIFGLVAWVANLVLVVLVNWLNGRKPDLMSWRDLMVGLVFGLVSGLVIGLRAKSARPRAMAFRRPKRSDLNFSVLLGGIGFGVLFGLVSGLVYVIWGANERLGEALGDGLILGISLGILFGLVALLAFWLVEAWHVPLAASLDVSPGVLYQKNWRSLLIEGPVVGVVGGFAVWVLWAVAGRQGLTDAVSAAIAAGLVFALVGALRSAARGGAALSLLLTEIALRLKKRRIQFMPLLQAALEKQVLRQAGAVYQFRHADLQDRLAERFEAGLRQRRPT